MNESIIHKGQGTHQIGDVTFTLLFSLFRNRYTTQNHLCKIIEEKNMPYTSIWNVAYLN